MKKLLSIMACLALFAACDSPEPTSSLQVQNPDLVFGVMSDTHIGAPPMGDTPENKLKKAYQKFTEIKSEMDAIVTVGDFTDNGYVEQYDTYINIMNEYSTAKNNLLLMGNHDNIDKNGEEGEARFVSKFGYKPTRDKVINGYHFITVSTRDSTYNTTSYKGEIKRDLEDMLARAHAQDQNKPIFVFIHHTMLNAKVIGHSQAEAAEEGDLYEVFSRYKQVITFSGHSHVSTADPRNIWQGDYTSLNCGSVLYAALDIKHQLTADTYPDGRPVVPANALNADNRAGAPYNPGESSTALVVEVRGTEVTVRRIDNYWNVEIPSKFVFDTSKDKSQFPYREEKRVTESVPPEFTAGAAITLDKIRDNGIDFTFPQATTNNSIMPDDGAFIYEVSIKEPGAAAEADKFTLQANYFMLPRPATISHNTKKLDPETSYVISITPVGYFGKKGTAPLTLPFTTAKLGEGDVDQGYTIPIAGLPKASEIPPAGIPINTYIQILSGSYFTLDMINDMLEMTLFFWDETMQTPVQGTDTVYPDTVIYSIFSIDELYALASAFGGA